MTLISKDVYDRRVLVSGDIDFESETIINITNQVNDLIDEIANYKPLYSARKKMQELGPDYVLEHMKKVAAVIIKLKLGEANGKEK